DRRPVLNLALATNGDAPVDSEFRWHVSGAPPGVRVQPWADATIGASQWMSDATCLSSDGGEVDPAAQPPVDGSYNSVDPSGLLWSLSHVSGPVDFPGRTVDPIEIDLAVSLGGKEMA